MTAARRESSAEVRAALLRDAEFLLRDPASATGRQRIVRIESAVSPVDLVSRLAAQSADAKWYGAARVSV